MSNTAKLKENPLEKIKNCIIPGILENVNDARSIIYENVRTGKFITPENIINDIVYKINKRLKDDKNIPFYKNNIILLETKDKKILEKNTLDWFKESKYSKKLEYFYDIKKGLMKVAFGEIPIPLFEYVQKRLNETGKQRIGGEKLKDAYIAIHPTRAWWILSDLGGSFYDKLLILPHDVIEERRDWRYKNIVYEIKHGLREYGTKERKLLKTENQEEFKEICDIVSKYDFGIGFYNGKSFSDWLSYNLVSITKNVKEEYEDYSIRLFNRIYSKDIIRIVESLTGDPEKQIELYSSVSNAKLADLIDNTDNLREGGLTKTLNRLDYNFIYLKQKNDFLIKHDKLNSETSERLTEELIKKSKEEIKIGSNLYKGKKNPALEVRIKKFRDLEIGYNRLDNPASVK
ncbi:MAG: hypothetical protein PHV16_02330 [Candidatus Nanoarchaeia archaeon]|nr:hypothetical protein [Candidatus Nanoarchaeia archaeon]